MINPNRTHIRSGTIQSIDPSHVAAFVVNNGKRTYSGYDLPKGIKVGEEVTFHIQFSIMSDGYTVVKDSVRRKRKTKQQRVDALAKRLGPDAFNQVVADAKELVEAFNDVPDNVICFEAFKNRRSA